MKASLLECKLLGVSKLNHTTKKRVASISAEVSLWEP
jgi:hypothetical protein